MIVGRSYIVTSRRSTCRSAVTTTHLHDFRTSRQLHPCHLQTSRRLEVEKMKGVFHDWPGFLQFFFNECMNGYIPWKFNIGPEKYEQLPGPNRNVAFQPPFFRGVLHFGGRRTNDRLFWIIATLGIHLSNNSGFIDLFQGFPGIFCRNSVFWLNFGVVGFPNWTSYPS